MKFVDEVIIEVVAGSGGNGCMSFRREKYIPHGGPDGGNGGNGGSVFFVACPNINNLLENKIKHKYVASSGAHGKSRLCHGKYGDDIFIKVPIGTKVYDYNTNELIYDIIHVDDVVCVAQGGKGGLGNDRFKSSTNRAPRQFTTGEEGQCRKIKLELNVLADVGLLGMPNAGKSTLLSVISKATPKIANYPFTTMRPHLGVVSTDFHTTFVVADIPGLIAGASEGVGLGHRFLKHLSRCELLLHVVDMQSELEQVDSVATIEKELEYYSKALKEKPVWLVINKCDLITPTELEKLKRRVVKKYAQYEQIFFISGVTRLGISEMINTVSAWVNTDSREK